MGYISIENQSVLNQRYRVTAMIVVVLGASAILWLLLPSLLLVEGGGIDAAKLMTVLYSASLILGLSTVVLRRVLLSRTLLAVAGRQGTPSLVARLTLTSVICAALGEMVAILSLMGYLASGHSFVWPVGAISLVLILYSFPRRGEWVRAVEANESMQRDTIQKNVIGEGSRG